MRSITNTENNGVVFVHLTINGKRYVFPRSRNRPHVRAVAVKHGMIDSPEYNVWKHMKDRCYNPRSQRWDRYGGRGIRVCKRWMTSFENFLADMGFRPSRNHSIERVNNEGNYEPTNCRWATRYEQNHNKSSSVFIDYGGDRLTVGQWSNRLGFIRKTLDCRLRAGWSVEDALTTPVAPRRRWTRRKPATVQRNGATR